MKFEVVNGIPRFVPKSNYSSSFGLQWNSFARTQLDSTQNTERSRERFENETGWSYIELAGKNVLDAGCGSGRFAEIALKNRCKLIAVDYSQAVEAAKNNLNFRDLLIMQADLASLPVGDSTMDYIYCIGVLQHTRNPQEIVLELLRCLRIGGELTLTFYENSSWHVRLYSKYLIRPITKRVPSKLLLALIQKTSAVWFPITSFLFRLPSPFSRIFRFLIPVANYVEFNYKDKQAAIEEAVLDTFDMLSPAFDRPLKKKTVIKWLESSGFDFEALVVNPKYGTIKIRKLATPS